MKGKWYNGETHLLVGCVVFSLLGLMFTALTIISLDVIHIVPALLSYIIAIVLVIPDEYFDKKKNGET